ncbi:MAG: phytanoyl-CoA dioxygenase family protein [Paenibacillaceae bacterium]|nr:phytanoyl-CoA dioxygenase family protein [Paenibacillaceae bacterium]
MGQLTQEQIKQYATDGYTIYNKPLFSQERMERLTSIFEEHLAAKGKKLSDELDVPHMRDERLLEFLMADEVLDLVQPIVGPNITLWSSHFICKDPFKGRATPWHEDSAYWNGRLDKYDKIVTVWLAIDRSNRENGCMRVIPGSQTNGFSQYESVDKATNLFATRIRPSDIDESKAVYFELEPGECSLHDARIIHGAEPNPSPYRRCGYTMRYVSADTHIVPERNATHPVWLARGVDLAGNKYANVTHA